MIHIKCGTEQRRIEVEKSKTINGIDYLEVYVNKSLTKDFRSLVLVGCFKDTPEFDLQNVAIDGGIRIKNVKIQWAQRADKIKANLIDKNNIITADLVDSEQALIKEIPTSELKNIIIVRPDSIGDFSMYSLRLQSVDNPSLPPDNFDPPLSKIDFSFKVECPSDYDYTITRECVPESCSLPSIDYMTKDFASFQRLMLDRFSTIVPDWKERNPSDLGIALIELLAYVGDNLSYYQDAVATEAYLGTARSRVSARRHARLLDYFINDGCNARTWVCFEINDDSGKSFKIPKKTVLLTSGLDNIVAVEKERFDKAIQDGAEIFETMDDVLLYGSHNEIHFYTWADTSCYLPKGTTSATLVDDNLKIEVGNVLIFEEILSPVSWKPSDRDPSHVHAVRLTKVQKTVDKLMNKSLVEISWDAQDALPFALCLYEKEIPKDGSKTDTLRVCVARGNVVLADHGYTILKETATIGSKPSVTEFLGNTPKQGKFRPRLQYKPLTFASTYDSGLSTSSAMHYDGTNALPQITLLGEVDPMEDKPWQPVHDLVSADEFARNFVVEVENDGTAYLRFGDGETRAGKVPLGSSDDKPNPFYATYRVGNGTKGNVGPETITRIKYDDTIPFDKSIIKSIRNPIAASGGMDPESIDEVRQYAPYRFLNQKRAVSEKDYEDILKMHPLVQRAHTTLRWTGSWYTVFIAVDRKESLDLDEKFKSDLLEYLDSYRLAGRDIKIIEPNYVPLDIRVQVVVKQNHYRNIVKQKLYDVFGNSITSEGTPGFFHPDNFTFGQPVYLSKIYSAAMNIEGISQVIVDRFQRWGMYGNEDLQRGYVTVDQSEIIRLDNDPNFQENGKIEFVLHGGL